MIIDPEDIGLRKHYLYEILATTFSKIQENFIPNTASMGIRVIDNNVISILPYPSTTTFKNLKKSRYLTINLVDNVYLYAVASLKNLDKNKNLENFSSESYTFFKISETSENDIVFPYLKEAWAAIFCKTIDEIQFDKKDNFGNTIISEFKLKAISIKKFKESFKLFNRAENIALETIILATRLIKANEIRDKVLSLEYKRKIEDNIQQIRRFGKNPNALKAIERVEIFIGK